MAKEHMTSGEPAWADPPPPKRHARLRHTPSVASRFGRISSSMCGSGRSASAWATTFPRWVRYSKRSKLTARRCDESRRAERGDCALAAEHHRVRAGMFARPREAAAVCAYRRGAGISAARIHVDARRQAAIHGVVFQRGQEERQDRAGRDNRHLTRRSISVRFRGEIYCSGERLGTSTGRVFRAIASILSASHCCVAALLSRRPGYTFAQRHSHFSRSPTI